MRNPALLMAGIMLMSTSFYYFVCDEEVGDAIGFKAEIDGNNSKNITTTALRRKQQRNRPIFVLHVGPRDTGAEFIQRSATELESVLDKDNFVYRGENNKDQSWTLSGLLYYCFGDGKQNSQACQTQRDELKKDLGSLRKHGKHVFMSHDSFNQLPSKHHAEKEFWEEIKNDFSSWDMRIVFTYRRFHEMLIGRYARHVDMGTDRNWPSTMQASRMVKFPTFFDKDIKQFFNHPSNIRKRWADQFSDIKVFNFHGHQHGDFVCHFFCQMIPEATNACKQIWSKSDKSAINFSHTHKINFDSLAVEAYERGIIDSKFPRKNVTIALEQNAQTTGYRKFSDYPLACLSSKQIDELLEFTIYEEKEVDPDFFLSRGQASLRDEIQKASKANDFCSIDLDDLMESDKWKQVFESFGCSDKTTSKAISKYSGTSKVPKDYSELDVNISFLGIGAHGGGTTWLAKMLMKHPQIAFGTNKELHFFGESNREKGLGWYSKQFPSRSSCIRPSLLHGEITPSYMSLAEEDVEEISVLFPSVRLVFLARDLVDRTWSQFRKELGHQLDHHEVTTSNPANYTDAYLLEKMKTLERYKMRETYASSLKRWYKYFPEDQILILNFDEIKSNPSDLLDRALRHIGIEENGPFLKTHKADLETHINPGHHDSMRPSLRKKMEDYFRPHAQEFNKLLRNHGYKWQLNDYA